MFRKSAAQLAREGSTRPRPSNPEPQGTPRKPHGLGQHGERLWLDLVPQLEEAGIATSVDESMLEMLCRWWERYQQLERALAKIADMADPIAIKLFDRLSQASNQYQRLAKQFGLTCHSRSQLNIDPAQDHDLDQYLS